MQPGSYRYGGMGLAMIGEDAAQLFGALLMDHYL